MVLNRRLNFTQAVNQHRTDSTARKHGNVWSAEEIDTRHSGTLNADAQLSHVILNAASAAAGDFFISAETTAQQSLNGKGS